MYILIIEELGILCLQVHIMEDNTIINIYVSMYIKNKGINILSTAKILINCPLKY